MLSSLLRLAMLAGTGAGMAAGLRRAMVKAAALIAVSLTAGLIAAVAIAFFGAAVYFALAPELGPVGSAVAVGGILVVLSLVLSLIARFVFLRPKRPAAASAGFGAPLGAAALGASMGGGGPDIRGALARNAGTVLLAAFIAGMVMNNRR